MFGDQASQAEVYRELAQPNVGRFIRGEANAVVFAYGQTGTGKTHTILGPERSWGCSGHPDAGVFPRAVGAVFEHFRGREADFVLHASAIEFYIATAHDLLDDERPLIGFNEMHEPGTPSASLGLPETSSLSWLWCRGIVPRGRPA